MIKKLLQYVINHEQRYLKNALIRIIDLLWNKKSENNLIPLKASSARALTPPNPFLVENWGSGRNNGKKTSEVDRWLAIKGIHWWYGQTLFNERSCTAQIPDWFPPLGSISNPVFSQGLNPAPSYRSPPISMLQRSQD